MVRNATDISSTLLSPPATLDMNPVTAMQKPLVPMDDKAWLTDSAEELTFQFSEKVEAETTQLEEKFEKGEAVVHAKDRAIHIKDVKAVIRMLEGQTAYDSIRRQAQVFAAAFTQDPKRALSLLNLNDMDGTHRYAILQLTLSALAESDNDRQAVAQLDRYIQPSGTDTLAIASLATSRGRGESAPSDSGSQQFFDMLDAKPTVLSVFDAVAERADSSHLEASIERLKASWPPSTEFNQLAQIGGLLLLHRIIGHVRSILHNARDLQEAVGVSQTHQTASEAKHARLLLDIANSALPSGQIDKFITALLSSPRHCPRCQRSKVLKQHCTCKDMKPHVLGRMYRMLNGWHEMVWARIEYKATVLEQLVKKQKSGNVLPWVR